MKRDDISGPAGLGPVRAWFWPIALTCWQAFGFAQAPGPEGARPGVPAPAPIPVRQTMVVQGAVAQYLMNPDGVIDGLLLESNTIVRFPPHLGQVLAEAVSPQDVVRVEGFFEGPGTVHASSIVNLQNRRAVTDAPPSQKHPRPPPPRRGDQGNRQALSAQGVIRVLTRSVRGDIDGAVLADGTIVHFPPPAGQGFAALLHEGHSLAVTGFGTRNEYGQSIEASAMGPSPAQLQTIAPGPDSLPPPGDASAPPAHTPP